MHDHPRHKSQRVPHGSRGSHANFTTDSVLFFALLSIGIMVESNTMLAKCNLKLAARLAEYYYDDLDREQIEPNPRVAKCNLKLADRLVEHCDEEKMKGVKLLLDEYYHDYWTCYDCLWDRYCWLLSCRLFGELVFMVIMLGCL